MSALKIIADVDPKPCIEDEFLRDFESLATRKTYKQSLEVFLEFIEEYYTEVESFSDIDRNMVVEYKNYIAEAGGNDGEQMAPNTIAKHLGAISSYFDFLIEKEIVNSNPASSVKRPKREVIRPTRAIEKDRLKSYSIRLI